MMHTRRRNDPPESDAHAHRRATDADAVARLHDRVNDHARRLDGHDMLLDGFSKSIDALNQNIGRVADVLEALTNLKGFWATLKLASAGSKIMLTLVAAGTAMWAAFEFLVWLSAQGV